MAKTKPVDQLSFEEAYQELQGIVEQLESGDLPLEESLSLFERGQALSERCTALLEKAELRLRKLTESGQGELEEVDLDVEEG